MAYLVSFYLLFALILVSGLTKAWVEKDLREGEPRTHFYSQEAADDCAAMSGEAKKRGATHWTCHTPALRSPPCRE